MKKSIKNLEAKTVKNTQVVKGGNNGDKTYSSDTCILTTNVCHL